MSKYLDENGLRHLCEMLFGKASTGGVPIASETVPGIVKIGAGLRISADGTLSVDENIMNSGYSAGCFFGIESDEVLSAVPQKI